jgi:epoxide hydrolase-like predicted phosphatase
LLLQLAEMIKAIIFDLGGVLMSDVPLKEIAEELDSNSHLSKEEIHAHLYPTEHWNLLTLGKITEDEYWDTFLQASKINVDRKHLRDKVRSSLYPLKHATATIRSLKNHYKLAILSNHAKEWSEYMKQKFDLFQSFKPIIFSCDVRLRKPDPKIYEIALEKLECDAEGRTIRFTPEECILVDDKKRNTDAAKKLGIQGIIFEEASRLLEDLRRAGVKIESTGSSDAITSGT